MITASIVTFHHTLQEVTKVLNCVINSIVERVYIVDNTSNDFLRCVVELSPKITYIHSENIGYGRAHNIAMRDAISRGSEYHIVINPDIFFESGVVESIEEYMSKNSDVGQLMPKIVYPNGEPQHLCKLLPTPYDLIARRFIPIKSIRNISNGKYELTGLEENRVYEIPSLSGCFMFLRCQVLKEVGLFDDRFFMYAEDLDLCRRVGEVSKTIFFPKVTVCHNYEKGSYKNSKLLRYHMSSVIKYFNKWGWVIDPRRERINKIMLEQIKQQ